MGNKEKDWISSIRQGTEVELDNLYTLYRDEFIVWSGAMYKLSEEEAADVFQDTVITFYWNIKKGKLTTLTSTVKTYLFAIGKNLALKKIRRSGRLVVDNDVVEYNADFEYDEMTLEITERQHVVSELLDELGDPCRTILKMFYFDRFSMDSIASRLGYKNENVAKTQKMRCLKKLKEMFKDHAINKDDV